LPPHENERAALVGGSIAISKVLGKPAEIATLPATTLAEIQQRLLSRRFFFCPETAAVIAGLAFSGCPR
jgi:hypothetical protein